MKTKLVPILRILTGISAGATALSTFDLSGVAHLIPGEYGLTLAGITLALKAIKELSVAAGDWLDDGQRNNSFKCHPLAFLGALVLALCLSSCTITKGLDGTQTTAPDHQETRYWGDLAKGLIHDLLVRPPTPPIAPPANVPAVVPTK